MKNKPVEQLAKEYRKTTPNQMYGDELGFISGFSANKKETEKILKDLKNKYKSWLSKEKVTKLAKTPNYIKQVTLEAKIEILNEIEKKLCQ